MTETWQHVDRYGLQVISDRLEMIRGPTATSCREDVPEAHVELAKVHCLGGRVRPSGLCWRLVYLNSVHEEGRRNGAEEMPRPAPIGASHR